MRHKFVRTSNVERFLAGTSAIDSRGAGEACLMLATGEAGFGKTETGEWWAVQNEGVFIRIKAACTPHWILTDLVRALGEQAPARSCEALFEQAFITLTREPRPIVLDEIEHAVKRDITVLETIRDLTDLVEVPLVLLGREFVVGSLRRQRQIWTRISAIAEFLPISLEDVHGLANELCEVPVEPEVLEQLHRESEGHIRQVVKGLANVERIGRRSGGKPVSRQIVGDTPLTAEWTRQRKSA